MHATKIIKYTIFWQLVIGAALFETDVQFSIG